jgi:NhaA family Na+:H+ antiporter
MRAEKNGMTAIEEFMKKESSAGILLIFVTILALFLQNSFMTEFYTNFLHTPVEIRFGDLQIAKPLLLWVNDGLMAVFFFLIGLEVKREVMEGHLSTLK